MWHHYKRKREQGARQRCGTTTRERENKVPANDVAPKQPLSSCFQRKAHNANNSKSVRFNLSVRFVLPSNQSEATGSTDHSRDHPMTPRATPVEPTRRPTPSTGHAYCPAEVHRPPRFWPLGSCFDFPNTAMATLLPVVRRAFQGRYPAAIDVTSSGYAISHWRRNGFKTTLGSAEEVMN